MLENLKKAVRDREMVEVGGGLFSPLEVQQFVRETLCNKRISAAVKELLPLLDQAGVTKLYVAPEGSHHRVPCTPEEIRISDLLESLIKETTE